MWAQVLIEERTTTGGAPNEALTAFSTMWAELLHALDDDVGRRLTHRAGGPPPPE
jgi:hypothetical protein